MMPVDLNKLFDLLIKYKNIVTALICLLIALLCFGLGRYSVSCPPKSEVCKAEEKTIKSQFEKLQAKDEECVKSLLKQVDDDEKECKERIKREIERYKQVGQVIDCETCEAIVPQCERRRTPICK